MKRYQRSWINKIKNKKFNSDLLYVCDEIIDDDTGHTDELSQCLAKEIKELLRIIRSTE